MSNRSTSSSRLSRPGSAVDLVLEQMGAFHADLQGNIGAVQENIGAVQANMGAIHADMQANIGAVQTETWEVLETVIHRLERLETSPVPKFVAGLHLNPQSF